MYGKILVLICVICLDNYIVFSQTYLNCTNNLDTSINNISIMEINEKLPVLVNLGWDEIGLLEQKKYNNNSIPFEPFYYKYNNCYLMVAVLEGTGPCYFEVGLNFKEISNRRHYNFKSSRIFYTNNNICIGMSEKKFIDAMKNTLLVFNTIRNETYAIYTFSCADKENEGYYQQGFNIPHQPDYICRYIFYKGKLVKMGFGYLPSFPTIDLDGL